MNGEIHCEAESQLRADLAQLCGTLRTMSERADSQAIREIGRILADERLPDFACVEAIVRVLERIVQDCGNRHDFG